MTATLIDPRNRIVTKCDQCGDWDDHPKVVSNRGWTRHHDCVPATDLVEMYGGTHSQHPLLLGKTVEAAKAGTRGGDLLELIQNQQMKDYGNAEMNTSGIDGTMANAILTALLLSTGTATLGTVTITAPMKLRFDSAMTTTDTGASTEWSTSGGYTAGGVSISTNWAAASAGSRATNAAVSVSNAPAQTWAGNEIWDSSGTPLRALYAALTGGNKTVNSGDTATVGSGNLTGTLHGS